MASTNPDTDLRAALPGNLAMPTGVADEAPGRHKGWFGALTFTVAMLVLFGLLYAPGSARAGVQIVPVEGAPVNLSLDQMPVPPDINGAVYTVRSEGGTGQVTVSGYSLAALLEAAGVDPVTIGYIEIPRPGGGALLLSRRQATTPGAFPEGPPVLYRDDQGLHFLRPSAGEADFNAADLISLPLGTALTLKARSGTLVKVSAKASARKVKVGQEVRFTASLDRSAAGEDVQISWYFDDGNSGTGAEVGHRFRKPGLYDVVVGVTTPGDRVGASATVTVQVGEPKKQGPKRRGGGTNNAKNAPDSGASEGGSGPASGPPSSGPLNTGSGSPSPSSGYTPPAAPPPPVPSPQPLPEPEPEPEPVKPPPPRPSGDEIVGELLSAEDIDDEPLAAITPQQVEQNDDTVAARTGSADPDTGGGGIPGAAVGVGAAILMLFGGGLLEARGIGRLRW